MIISRGILAMLFVLGVVVFALFNIVLDPVRETGLMPLKEIRSASVPLDFVITQQPVWNIVVVSFSYSLPQACAQARYHIYLFLLCPLHTARRDLYITKI